MNKLLYFAILAFSLLATACGGGGDNGDLQGYFDRSRQLKAVRADGLLRESDYQEALDILQEVAYQSRLLFQEREDLYRANRGHLSSDGRMNLDPSNPDMRRINEISRELAQINAIVDNCGDVIEWAGAYPAIQSRAVSVITDYENAAQASLSRLMAL